MSWLSGTTDNLKPKKFKKHNGRQGRDSSPEYQVTSEEEDEDKEEIYHVKKIVEHRSFTRGHAWQVLKLTDQAFNVSALEKSKWCIAFRVNWRGYGSDEDTWEPIENFTTSLTKKLKKYCRRNQIELPEGFEDWLLPISGSDNPDTSGSDHTEEAGSRRGISAERQSRTASPAATSNSRSRAVDDEKEKDREKKEKKEAEKKRMQQLKEDLALSPSPTPTKDDYKTSIDHLFDVSDEEPGPSVKKEMEEDTARRALFTIGSPDSEKEKKKEKKSKKNGSIDASEKRKRKEEKRAKRRAKEEALRQRNDSFVFDDNASKKEEKRKKSIVDPRKERRAEIEKQSSKKLKDEEDHKKKSKEKRKEPMNDLKELEEESAEFNMKLKEEEVARRARKLAKKNKGKARESAGKEREREVDKLKEMGKEKEKEKTKSPQEPSVANGRARVCSLSMEVEAKGPQEPSVANGRARVCSLSMEVEAKGWAPIPEALIEPMEEPSSSKQSESTMSHHEIEQKRKRQKLEKKMKEKRREQAREERRKEEGEGRERHSGHSESDERPRIEVKKEKRERHEGGRRKGMAGYRIPKRKVIVEEDEEEEETGAGESESAAVAAHFASSSSEDEEEDEIRKLEMAHRRWIPIRERLAGFAALHKQREQSRLEAWGEEEDRWRRGMYERGVWVKEASIDDQPFNIRAEMLMKNVKYVRTLRRCRSLECLPCSFRRASAYHSMDTMASEAESLAEALLEREREDKAERLREARARIAERKSRQEEKERRERWKAAEAAGPQPDVLDLDNRIEQFVRETKAMAAELIPGVATDEMIREMTNQAVRVFLSLDFAHIIPIFEQIALSDCINRTILRLVRIFSPICNLLEADEACKNACDGGEHRKCRMLLTLLMTLSAPMRMGDDEGATLLPPNALYDATERAASCQIRAMIRGGCTFDHYYDKEGRNAAHMMMEKYSQLKLIWLIERGLDVNSAVLPMKESDLARDTYDKPWKLFKESHEKFAFISQLHSQRLTARSLMWTRSVPEVAEYSMRPLSLVHTITPHSFIHRFAAVTLCDVERRGFTPDDAVLLAVHSATVRQGRGLRLAPRKRKNVPELRIPFFLIDRAHDDESFECAEKYECERARLTIHVDVGNYEKSETIELEKIGDNGPTAVFKVPKKQAMILISGRRFTETQLRCVSPPEDSVILAQFVIVPFRLATGKFHE